MLGVWWIFGFDSVQYFECGLESDNKKLNKLAKKSCERQRASVPSIGCSFFDSDFVL